MKKRFGKISITVLITCVIALLAVNAVIQPLSATPIHSDASSKLGGYTGNSGAGAADNTKADIDILNAIADDILADTASMTGSGTPIAGQTYVISSASAVVTSASVQLFAVAGGHIEIISMFGECTVDMAGGPTNLSLILDATTGDYDADFTTAVNIDAVNKGDIIQFAAVTAGEAVLVETTGVNAGLPVSWFATIGDIEQLTSSTGTGAITWHMTYRILTAGTTVTAY
jgi:hypothetical protein